METNVIAKIIGGIAGGIIILYFMTFLLGKFVAQDKPPLRRAVETAFLATLTAIVLYWLVGNQGDVRALPGAAMSYIPAGLVVGYIRFRMYRKSWIE